MKPCRCRLALVCAATPAPASAHLVSTGLGPFYDGIGHFFLNIETLLPLLALAILGGLQGAGSARRLLVGVPCAWLAGALLIQVSAVPSQLAVLAGNALLAALLLLFVGMLAVINRSLGANRVSAIGLVAGMALGIGDGFGLGARAQGGALLIGNLLAMTSSISLLLALTVRLAGGPSWQRIGLRVLASWLSAAGLLLIGWYLRA